MESLPPLIGRYQVQARLGSGGMGTVLLAHDPQLGRRVAVKLVQAHLDSTDFRDRFAREARAVAALNHPHIVTVYDFGYFGTQPFLVLEYIDGRTLAKVIERREEVPIALRLRWLEELCEGLEYAHQNGLVHRDVKPANVMIDHLDHAKVLDFGIAKFTGNTTRTLTSTSGTPMYMAPECIRGEAADRRADVFAVGAVAYQLLTYREPFGADTAFAVMHRVLESEPPPFGEAGVSLDPEIEQIVLKALRKRPQDRFATAWQMQEQIEGVRSRLESGAPHNAGDLRAREAVSEARRLFARREHLSALALLRRFQPPHPHVTAAFASLQAELQELQRKEIKRR